MLLMIINTERGRSNSYFLVSFGMILRIRTTGLLGLTVILYNLLDDFSFSSSSSSSSTSSEASNSSLM